MKQRHEEALGQAQCLRQLGIEVLVKWWGKLEWQAQETMAVREGSKLLIHKSHSASGSTWDCNTDWFVKE